MREELLRGIYTFVTSKVGRTKGVVFHEGGLSKGVPLYLNLIQQVFIGSIRILFEKLDHHLAQIDLLVDGGQYGFVLLGRIHQDVVSIGRRESNESLLSPIKSSNPP